MPKRFFKFIYLTVLSVFLALLVGAFFISRPGEIHVSAYTKPYSINSSVNVKDSIEILILIDQAESFYSDKDQIVSAYIKGDEGKIKLLINEIEIESECVDVNDKDFFVFHYYFNIDFSSENEFKLFIKDAFLELSFLNSTVSTIKIGSFSYFKYTKSDNDLMFSLLKVINNYNNDTNLFGFQIGIRNISDYEIKIKSINLLDVNAFIGEGILLDEISDSKNINDYFSDYESIEYLEELDISINSLENLIYAFPLVNMSEYNLMFPIERLGFNIVYTLNNKEYNYIFENFMFYSSNDLDFSNCLFDVYTYDNN